MEKTGLFDINGEEFERGQVVSFGKCFDDNEEFGYVEKEFGNWQVIGIAKEWNNKTYFQLDLNARNRIHGCKIVDDITLEYSFEEIRNRLHMID